MAKPHLTYSFARAQKFRSEHSAFDAACDTADYFATFPNEFEVTSADMNESTIATGPFVVLVNIGANCIPCYLSHR